LSQDGTCGALSSDHEQSCRSIASRGDSGAEFFRCDVHAPDLDFQCPDLVLDDQPSQSLEVQGNDVLHLEAVEKRGGDQGIAGQVVDCLGHPAKLMDLGEPIE
jgi:hypothetical protein